jgi:putative transposase
MQKQEKKPGALHNQQPTTNNQNGTISIQEGRIKLPKLKSMLKIKLHRNFEGRIKSCTISRIPTGKYYISILVETEIEAHPPCESVAGIDLGIKTFAVVSDGTEYENPKQLRKSEKRLKALQKELNRKKLGSRNREKARLRVARLHERIANQRRDFLHKTSSKIISENQVIMIEDLRIKNLKQNHKMAKAIAEVSWSKFREMLSYKARWYGRELKTAPSNYPSSQLCSGCGNQSSQTKDLTCRTYLCGVCGLELDRDLNASLNLKKLALQ